jgi:IS4 transposase
LNIEVLFKELKQNLKIGHFIAKNLNGILIQIFCTLISYLLFIVFKLKHRIIASILEIKREIRYFGNISYFKAFG